MLKNGVFWVEWRAEGLSTAGRADVKRGDLRAFLGSVEGLYPLEGEVRNAGVLWRFMGKVERCLSPTEGICSPYEGLCPKNLREIFWGIISMK